jgi:hypothetical protein
MNEGNSLKRANRVRRERWWSTAGVKPVRELVRSTRLPDLLGVDFRGAFHIELRCVHSSCQIAKPLHL